MIYMIFQWSTTFSCIKQYTSAFNVTVTCKSEIRTCITSPRTSHKYNGPQSQFGWFVCNNDEQCYIKHQRSQSSTSEFNYELTAKFNGSFNTNARYILFSIISKLKLNINFVCYCIIVIAGTVTPTNVPSPGGDMHRHGTSMQDYDHSPNTNSHKRPRISEGWATQPNYLSYQNYLSYKHNKRYTTNNNINYNNNNNNNMNHTNNNMDISDDNVNNIGINHHNNNFNHHNNLLLHNNSNINNNHHNHNINNSVIVLK